MQSKAVYLKELISAKILLHARGAMVQVAKQKVYIVAFHQLQENLYRRGKKESFRRNFTCIRLV